MKITAIANRRRVATNVIAVALMVLGFYSLWRLPVNFLPEMTHPLARLLIYWRGATPEEIITNIADPVERQMASVDGLDYLESTSFEGMYILEVNFQYGRDIDVAYQDALAALGRAARQLPKDIDPPILFKADPSQLPVLQLVIRSDQWDLVKLRTWTDNWLKDRMLAIPGVASAEIVGGLQREIRIHLDPGSLEKYGLSLTGILRKLNQENLQQFAGRVTAGPKEFIARTMGEYRNLEEIKSVALAQQGQGGKVYVGDVARVEDWHEEVRVMTRLDGKPGIKLSVVKQADANTVEVAKAVQKRIQELQTALPSSVQLIVVENQANYVETALAGVRNAALEAAGLVLLVVYLFLGSWRQVLVMTLVLPLTLILNFILMKLAGFSINIFSLGGLVVAIGVILDNSIVVLENISRLWRKSRRAQVNDLAVEGTREVGPAILASTLSFLAIFLPFLLVPGLSSLLFKELILVVSGIVVISLLVAITMTPMLTAWLMGAASGDHAPSWFEKFFDGVIRVYGRSVAWAIRWRWIVIAAFGLMVIAAGILIPRVGSEFLPRMDDGRVMVKVKLPTGTSVEQTNRVLSQIEAQLSGDPLVESLFSLAGGRVQGVYTYEVANEGELNLQLIPRHARKISTEAYINKIRPRVAQISIPGGKAMVTPMKIKGLRQVGKGDIEVEIKGQDMNRLFGLAQQVSGIISQSPRLTNVLIGTDLSKPEYQIQVDRTRAAELGVSVADIAGMLRTLVGGSVATRLRDGEYYYNIRVMVAENRIQSRQDLDKLPLESGRGGYLRLRDLARTVPATGPVEIVRKDQVKKVVVSADAAGASVGQALGELKKALARLELPTGYEITFGGQAQTMAQMQRDLLLVLAFALFFAFVVHAVQWNSLRLPWIILVSLPGSLSGLVLALWVTGIPLGATVVIGILVVAAATINEGVLLLTFAEELRASQNSSPLVAVVEAAKIRLRPRLMITLMVITGFLPLALNLEEGGDMLQPMAVGAIGGLALGIFVALFLMPCLYVIFTRERRTSPEWNGEGQSPTVDGPRIGH